MYNNMYMYYIYTVLNESFSHFLPFLELFSHFICMINVTMIILFNSYKNVIDISVLWL